MEKEDSKQEKLADVPEDYYIAIFKIIDDLGKLETEFKGDTKEYEEARLLAANLVYLIYERLELKTARQVNYSIIREWASRHYKLAMYLLEKQFKESFSMTGFQKWVDGPPIPIMEMTLYSRSNCDTKDTFH